MLSHVLKRLALKTHAKKKEIKDFAKILKLVDTTS